MHPNQLLGVVAIGGVCAAAAWLVLTVLDEPAGLKRPGPPPAVEAGALVVSPPRFFSFERYYAGNDQNPFLPSDQRQVERLALEEDPDRVEEQPQVDREPLPVPQNIPTIAGPQEPDIPVLEAEDAPDDRPQVLGIMRHSDSGVMVVQVALGAGGHRSIRPGEDFQGWRLVAAGDGSATFRAPDGTLREIPIGNDG